MLYEETKYILKTKRRIGVLLIEVTSNCNFKCKHCYNESRKKTSHISLNALQKIRDDIKCISGIELIELSGGEFFLHKNWIEILELFKEYTIQVTTNGSLLSEETLSILRHYGVKLAISIDGLSPEDNYLRNPKLYENVHRGIENAIKYYDTSLITLHCTINTRNYNKINDIADYCYSNNIKLNFGCLCKLGFGKLLDECEIPDSNTIYQSYKNIIEINNKLNIGISLPPLGVSSKCTLLGYAKISPRISVEGDVYPCSSLTDKAFSIGNIYEDTLSEMLLKNNKRLENVVEVLLSRSKYMSVSSCKNCSYVSECGGGCVAFALSENTNDFLSTPGRFCMAAKLLKAREAFHTHLS